MLPLVTQDAQSVPPRCQFLWLVVAKQPLWGVAGPVRRDVGTSSFMTYVTAVIFQRQPLGFSSSHKAECLELQLMAGLCWAVLDAVLLPVCLFLVLLQQSPAQHRWEGSEAAALRGGLSGLPRQRCFLQA